MIGFGYVRVSTEGQAAEGISLEAQQAKIQAWCLANDVELGGVFVDAGISGKRADNRPELQNALAAVTKAKGVIVVYSLSRLARSVKDTLAISESLDKAGADLVSLSEKLDTTSAAGKMVFRLLAVLAEFERDLVSERTCAAMQHKKAQGKRVGQVPFGSSLAEDGQTLVVNKREQTTIELIQVLRSTGLSYGKIAEVLNRKMVKPKKVSSKWAAMTVRGIVLRATS